MDNAASQGRPLDAFPTKVWEILSQKKVYFGHQSVGGNIIDGIKDILGRQAVVRLDIRETTNPADFVRPIFAHSLIGRNTDPRSKIDHFRIILESGIGQAADLAMFKLCFVDIDGGTDLESLFEHYSDAIAALERKFPHLRIVTWSVPLTGLPPGLKSLVKRLMGRASSPATENIPRNTFNQKLRSRFGDALFDLARAETTLESGARSAFKVAGRSHERLRRAYSGDGGHLNALGSRAIARELLDFLAQTFSI